MLNVNHNLYSYGQKLMELQPLLFVGAVCVGGVEKHGCCTPGDLARVLSSVVQKNVKSLLVSFQFGGNFHVTCHAVSVIQSISHSDFLKRLK